MEDSNEKYRKLQRMADYLCRKIENRSIDVETVQQATSRIRETALEYFPDRAELFEMVYASRFKRLSEQHLLTR